MTDEIIIGGTVTENDTVINADVSIDNESLNSDFGVVTQIVTSDYNKLKNIPTLNGQVLKGDVDEIDPTVPYWAKQNTKPTYTSSEVNAVGADDAMTLEDLALLIAGIF